MIHLFIDCNGTGTGADVNGNPLQVSCLENPMDRGAWRATLHRIAKSWTQLKQLSMHAHTCTHTHAHSVSEVKSFSHVRLFVTLWTVACTRVLHPWDFLGKSTGVGCHFLLQGILPTQGSNPGLLH